MNNIIKKTVPLAIVLYSKHILSIYSTFHIIFLSLSLLGQQDNPQENEILYLNFINTCKTKITKSNKTTEM